MPPAAISIDVFGQVDLRVGKIISAENHPNADKLLVLKVKIGPADTDIRQICAGIRAFRQPEQMVGKSIIIVANLEPRKVRGVESQGMMLAAGGKDAIPLGILTPDTDVPPGTKIS